MSVEPRLRRLFAADGRCAVGAVDLGLFGEPSWLDPVRDVAAIIEGQAASGLDAMTLAPGPARVLQRLVRDRKPALILRGDVTDVYRSQHRGAPAVHVLTDVAERAVQLDAAAVIAALLSHAEHPSLASTCVRGLDALRADTQTRGLPLVIEVAVLRPGPGVPGMSLDDVDALAALARQAAELGADVVKVEPPADVDAFAQIVDAVHGIPVLAGSGAPVADEEVLLRTRALMRLGAAGAAYGRKILQADDPVAMARAVAQAVHTQP